MQHGSELSKTKSKHDDDYTRYDFIRFTWSDTMGIPRCKVVPSHAYPGVVKSGLGMGGNLSVSGADSLPCHYSKFADRGCPDSFAVPQLETWHSCPWSGNDTDSKVAEVLCELHEKDVNLTPCGYDSRVVCRRMLSSLKEEFGLDVYSALEYEFAVSENGKAPDGSHNCSTVILKKMEKICFEVSKRLKTAQVLVETIVAEFGNGQFEITLEPQWGLKAVDNGAILRDCVKSTAIDKGMQATFMSNPWGTVQNGGHYNFSLWKSGQNALSDKSDENGLSELGKFWIAGIMEHAGALTAIGCQTNNCYRRFYEGGFAPIIYVCYAQEHRKCLLRIKESQSSGTFFEFRLSGAPANPYLLVAAILAAGMDGLRKRIQPPPIGFSEERQIPRTLEDALEALDKDCVIKKALGDDIIEPFFILKRQKDLKVTDPQEQFKFYSDLM